MGCSCGSQVILCNLPVRFDTYVGCSHGCRYFRHVNTPFKVKSHRSNKRAYNAIEDTIRLRGFAI